LKFRSGDLMPVGTCIVIVHSVLTLWVGMALIPTDRC
jgi:hypothetical protein